jgi:hypothetical protein
MDPLPFIIGARAARVAAAKATDPDVVRGYIDLAACYDRIIWNIHIKSADLFRGDEPVAELRR